MHLIPVTPESVGRYVAFHMEIATEETRNYFRTVDAEAIMLRNGTEFFFENTTGQITAAISLTRKPARDGTMTVMITVEIPQKDRQMLTETMFNVLHAEEGRLTEQETVYRLYTNEELPLLDDNLKAIGFERKIGRYRYVRPPGPPKPGEFPHAERARENGYETLIINDDFIAAHPDIFEKLADLHNRAFFNQEAVLQTTAQRIRSLYDKNTTDIFIAKLGDEVAGSISCTFLGNSVLSPQYASLRKHWGTGASDLMSRHLAQHVADRWNVPIIAYADATNAASWKSMERFGLTRDQELSHWERRFPAGSTFRL